MREKKKKKFVGEKRTFIAGDDYGQKQLTSNSHKLHYASILRIDTYHESGCIHLIKLRTPSDDSLGYIHSSKQGSFGLGM